METGISQCCDAPDLTVGQVMLIEDDPHMRESLTAMLLAAGMSVRAYGDGTEALQAYRYGEADVVLTDVHMPRTDGLTLLERLRGLDAELPVILMTGNAELDTALSAIRMKAFELFIKPFAPATLVTAIRKGIRHKRLQQLDRNYRNELERTVAERTGQLSRLLEAQHEMNNEIIVRLATAAKLRDDDIGCHISRIGLYAAEIARELGAAQEFIDVITLASTMHDIGKIGIPDAILFKAGPLNRCEFKTIQTHTLIGANILRGSTHPLLQMAASIAMNHHERWDGSGYPRGLRGERVPLAARIVMLADQYDALRSKRVYKPAMDHGSVLAILREGDEKTQPWHFDPTVLKAFVSRADRFEEIFAAGGDGNGGDGSCSFRSFRAYLSSRKGR